MAIMDTTVRFASANYRVYDLRVGMLLKHLNSSTEVYLQPGDDTAILREALDALDEVPENRREIIFDILCSECF